MNQELIKKQCLKSILPNEEWAHLYHTQLKTIWIALDIWFFVVSQVSHFLEGVHKVKHWFGATMHFHKNLMQQRNVIPKPILICFPFTTFAYCQIISGEKISSMKHHGMTASQDWTHNQFWRCQLHPTSRDLNTWSYHATRNKNGLLRNCLASQRDNNQHGLRAQIIQPLASSAPIDDNMPVLALQAFALWSHPCRIYGIHRYLPQFLSIMWHSREICHVF